MNRCVLSVVIETIETINYVQGKVEARLRALTSRLYTVLKTKTQVLSAFLLSPPHHY